MAELVDELTYEYLHVQWVILIAKEQHGEQTDRYGKREHYSGWAKYMNLSEHAVSVCIVPPRNAL